MRSLGDVYVKAGMCSTCDAPLAHTLFRKKSLDGIEKLQIQYTSWDS